MNLGEFGQWWSSQEWGSVGQWFSGLLTAATLATTLLLLSANRKKDTHAQADSFLSLEDTVMDETGIHWRVRLVNASDGPISGVIVRSRPHAEEFAYQGIEPEEDSEGLRYKDFGLIRTDEERMVLIVRDKLYGNPGFILRFNDSRSHTWYRELKNGRYLSEREISKYRKETIKMKESGNDHPSW
ncbi:hypothetical protein QN355_11695 [Cryobacterium sp. 10S3]|uniref:hypothetical protein n=1 Tax=Cryobacterium sp. 10S3 TaxID=3048582 RepID=UPI002AC9C15E|nr:hypothetical protein [Cryobacterium sp. 10S3]MEB0287217.1 hypothetical protein [Cryobacterium sp. 10S3]WPX14172.1 hypothetical protein RHM57_02015 [Cryobacterium sp. 10S3]